MDILELNKPKEFKFSTIIMKGTRHIETTRERDIEIIKQQVNENIEISKFLYDYIIDIGDNTDYELVIYMYIDKTINFSVDELITYIQEHIIDEAEDREDYEVEQGQQAIKELEQRKGWYLEEK